MPIECSVNAATGREKEAFPQKSKNPKKVLVIGGGPGGMEAARIAALKGHRVLLYEQNPFLGGAMLPASKPPYKEDIQDFIDYLSFEIRELGVEIELDTYVTPELVKSVNPDTIVIATGATSSIPDIPGITNSQVITAEEILSEKAETGDTVAVIGGGMIGCETAGFLVSKGKKVAIIETMDKLARDMMPMIRRPLLDHIAEKGVTSFTGVTVEEVTDSGVIITDKSGAIKKIDAESVVLAVGAKSNRVLMKMLGSTVFKVHVVGDCLEPRGIREAVKEGFAIGMAI